MESVHIACQNLPTLSAWTGESHDAGTAAFRRANNTATAVASFAASVGSALCTGAYTLGKARTDLLVKADAVDAGRLWVTDAWVVLIDPIELTLEEADGLAEEANRHQGGSTVSCWQSMPLMTRSHKRSSPRRASMAGPIRSPTRSCRYRD